MAAPRAPAAWCLVRKRQRRARQQLMPEENWEIFLEVTSQEISQADAARKYGVDVSVIIRAGVGQRRGAGGVRVREAGAAGTAQDVELELLRAENDRLSEALKEMAVELTLHRERERSCYLARSPRA